MNSTLNRPLGSVEKPSKVRVVIIDFSGYLKNRTSKMRDMRERPTLDIVGGLFDEAFLNLDLDFEVTVFSKHSTYESIHKSFGTSKLTLRGKVETEHGQWKSDGVKSTVFELSVADTIIVVDHYRNRTFRNFMTKYEHIINKKQEKVFFLFNHLLDSNVRYSGYKGILWQDRECNVFTTDDVISSIACSKVLSPQACGDIHRFMMTYFHHQTMDEHVYISFCGGFVGFKDHDVNSRWMRVEKFVKAIKSLLEGKKPILITGGKLRAKEMYISDVVRSCGGTIFEIVTKDMLEKDYITPNYPLLPNDTSIETIVVANREDRMWLLTHCDYIFVTEGGDGTLKEFLSCREDAGAAAFLFNGAENFYSSNDIFDVAIIDESITVSLCKGIKIRPDRVINFRDLIKHNGL